MESGSGSVFLFLLLFGDSFPRSFEVVSLKASLCSNRAEEMNSSHMTELEEDIQQQLSRTEERVRQEVSVAPAAPVTCKDWIVRIPLNG